MDEGLLNDLLECSVCLERLDTSSRVLPCQHTFCLKCLKVIVESHRELRCPECRILVDTKLEELPPNVLLMRILEGMRHHAPKKPSAQRPARSQQGQSPSIHAGAREGKSVPPHARAMYDYISKEAGDLSFKKGETILLHKKLDPFWYQGECDGRSGMFPITYVQVLVPLVTPTALCKALYDFRMSAPDEEGCLAFDKGAIITVVRRVDENWAEGRLQARLGIFPIAFVELNHQARQLMNTPPLNRPVPPLPEHARPSHSEHRHHTQHTHRYQPMSLSTPATGQGNYQNMANMSQSQPNYHGAPPILAPTSEILVQPINSITTLSHGLLSTTATSRNIMEPTQTKHALDLIHFTSMHSKGSPQTMGIQSVSRIGENYDRLRSNKYENYSNPTQQIHKETTYQNVRSEHFPISVASFNANVSSDSSSSVNTPSVGVSSTTTPNSSSNTSSCESAEPSLPSSPDNNTERNATVVPPTQPSEEENTTLDSSMGVLSLNESSTATNTSLNVSLPPAESPELNASAASTSSQNQEEVQESSSNNEPCRAEAARVEPSTSKQRSSGPDSLMNFGLGLQAALSPSHAKDGNYMVSRVHREREIHREREKRHSLTPASHLQGNHSQNRHSAEIVATSLLDHTPTRERDKDRERARERERRRRSNERTLPASYIALYPYKPQKPDELELSKGGVYVVTERCRDGWFKGWGERHSRAGVFPGNYLAPLYHEKSSAAAAAATPAVKPVVAAPTVLPPPDAPPRENTPHANTGQQSGYHWTSQHSTPKSERSKDKQKSEKSSISSGVSLMKRLAAMKKCKSPPCAYSMDNPVFEDAAAPPASLEPAPAAASPLHHAAVHVRSGSCPSQLLLTLPGSERIRHKERPTILHHQFQRPTADGTWQGVHRKSQSLDVTAARRDKYHAPPLNERFRCIVPYPPNSDYELELKVDDIVIVSKKRGDGWYKGTLQRTGRTGLFPASFVQSCPNE